MTKQSRYGAILKTAAAAFVFLFLFFLAVHTEQLVPGPKAVSVPSGVLAGESEVWEAVSEKNAVLPDMRKFYDSLSVNEEYAGKIRDTVTAILTSKQGELFRDTYFNGEERIRFSGDTDMEPIFSRYQFLSANDQDTVSDGFPFDGQYRLTLSSMDLPADRISLRLSSAEFVKKLEEAGYQGLKDWMREIERMTDREFPDAWNSTGSKGRYTIVLNGVLFHYTAYKDFSVTFRWDSYYVRPELLNEMNRYSGDGFVLRRSAGGEELSMLEYCTPSFWEATAESELSAAKRIRLYYGKEGMREITIYAQERQTGGTLFGNREEELMLRFLSGLGMSEQEAGDMLTRLSQLGAGKYSENVGGYRYESKSVIGMNNMVSYGITITKAE